MINTSIFTIVWQAILARKVLLLSLAVLLVTLPILYLVIKYQSPIQAAWYNDNWLYRITLTIGNTGAADANKKVKFDIDTATLITAGKIQSDCGDSRFTDINGRVLKYFIDTAGGACNSASTDYYVLVPTIFSGNTVLYHYYGNPSAENGTQSSQFSEATFTPTSGPTGGSEEKSAGPIAYWKFDEGQGVTANNSTSVTGINGTITGATWQNEDQCISGKCLYFNGTNNRVDTNTKLSDITSEITVSSWVYPINPPNVVGRIIATTYDWDATPSLQRGWTLGNNYGSTDAIYMSVYDSSGTSSTATLNNFFANYKNKWVHVVGVYKAGQYVRIYINGQLAAETTSSIISAIAPGTVFNLRLGTRADTTGQAMWDGKMDEVKIYPYARTAAQIKSDYNSQGTVKGSSVQIGSKNPRESFSQGLVGYWKMDESATPSLDSSGNGNSGTWNGTAAAASGKFGNAISLDGDSDYVQVTAPSPTNAVTVGAWVKTKGTPTGGYHIIFMQGSTAIELDISTAGVLRTGITTTTNGRIVFDSGSGMADGTWHHILLTYDGINIKSFKDGEYISSTPQSGPIVTGGNTFIGQYASSYYANAIIDDVRIYNRALSPKEVRDLYNWAPGPVGYWNMDEKTGQTVNDLSGNGNSGTLGANSSVGSDDPTWISGKYGGGLSFNNSNSTYVNIANTTSLSTISNKNFTFAAWIKINTTGTYQMPIAKKTGSSASSVFDLETPSNGSANYNFYIGDGTNANNTGQTPFNFGEWTHVSGSSDGSKIRLYINGVLRKEASITISDWTNTQPIQIGGPSYPINGFVDDVRIYNYARNSKQIVEDMNAGHPSGGSPVGSQVGYWKFDEGYGTTANNIGFGGTTLNGTFGSSPRTPSWTNNGKFGKALSFDASTPANGDIINIPDSAALQVTTGLTISAWINPSARVPSQTEWIVGRALGVSPWDDYNLTRNGNNIAMQVRLASGMITATATNAVATTGIWYHLLGTYDAVTGKLNLYINGQNKGSASGTGNIQVLSTRFKIGCWGTAADNCDSTTPFNGLIDEVKIYNSALTEDEIKLDYNHGSAMVLGKISTDSDGSTPSDADSRGYCIPGDTTSCSAPVGEWKMDEKTGTNAYDTSGNGNTGTVTNAIWKSSGQCKQGACLYFDGSGDEVTLGAAKFDTLSNATIEMFFYYSGSFDANRQLFNHYKDANNRQVIFVSYSGGYGNKLVYENIVASSNRGITSNSTLTANTWYHAAFTCGTGGMKMYLNGVQQTSTNATTDCLSTIAATVTNAIGASIVGQIDSVKIYDYVRTPSQIAYDYNRGGPVGWWKMDECQGNTLNDANGNANGTLTVGATGSQTAVGTCTTSGTAWYNGVTGKYNSSLNFDGTDDQILRNSGGFLPTGDNPRTISFWFKPSAGMSTANGAFGYGCSTEGYGCSSAGVGRYVGAWANTSNIGMHLETCQVTGPSTPSPTTNWHFYTAIFNGNNTISYYIDGIGPTTVTPGCTINTSAGNGFSIGVARWGYYNGQIDDVKIFNYALTGTQIKTLYNQGAAVQFAPATGSP